MSLKRNRNMKVISGRMNQRGKEKNLENDYGKRCFQKGQRR